jgi:hypothetical protein
VGAYSLSEGIGAQGLAQTSPGSGLIRVPDDVESEALAILNHVHRGKPGERNESKEHSRSGEE